MTSDARRRGRPSLAQNTIAQSAPLLAAYLASFISAPVVLGGLGLRAFGIWALTGAIAQYAALLDFGVGPSLARFVALYDAESRPDLIGEVMSAGLTTSLLIGAALCALSVFAAGPLAHQVGGISPTGMRELLLAATGMFVCSTLVNALTAYRVGLRRMVAPGVLATIGAGVNFSCSIGAVVLSSSLVLYGLANAAASLITLLLTAAYVLGVRDGRAPYRRPTMATVKDLISFSIRNQMQTAASLINNQTDKIVIAIFIGPAAAGAYELANRVAAAARSIGVYTVSAMVPTLTVQLRHAKRETWAGTYERLTASSTALAVPVLLLSAALAPILLGAWLGSDPRHGAFVLAALSIAYVLNATTGVGFSFAYARGFPGIPATAAVVTAVANIVLTATLAPLFGIWGVLTGTAIALTAGAFLQVLLVHRRLGMPLSRYWRAVGPTLGRAVTLAAPVFICCSLLDGTSRTVKILATCACAVGYVLLYVAISHRRGSLPAAISRRLAMLPITGS